MGKLLLSGTAHNIIHQELLLGLIIQTVQNITATDGLHIVRHQFVELQGILLVKEQKTELVTVDKLHLVAVQFLVFIDEIGHVGIIVLVATTPLVAMNAIAYRHILIGRNRKNGSHLGNTEVQTVLLGIQTLLVQGHDLLGKADGILLAGEVGPLMLIGGTCVTAHLFGNLLELLETYGSDPVAEIDMDVTEDVTGTGEGSIGDIVKAGLLGFCIINMCHGNIIILRLIMQKGFQILGREIRHAVGTQLINGFLRDLLTEGKVFLLLLSIP